MSNSEPRSPLPGTQNRIDYTALSSLGGQTAHIQFNGPFEGREILWDTHLITLQEIYHQGIAAGTYSPQDTISLSQFIEINEKDAAEFALTVGIDVPAIDAPTVLKTIIMIHNYKRLRRGRHEYGPPVNFHKKKDYII